LSHRPAIVVFLLSAARKHMQDGQLPNVTADQANLSLFTALNS